MKDLAEQHSGYIAKSNVRGRPGSPRSGEWTIRVPVANYEDFLAAARELGETRSVRTDSDDVTAEFYDVEARIRNKKQEEDRLRKHLEDSTGKLEDILHVEREISRVRGEIERMEGRMRVLKDLTSLTTINLRVDEIEDYILGMTTEARVRKIAEKYELDFSTLREAIVVFCYGMDEMPAKNIAQHLSGHE